MKINSAFSGFSSNDIAACKTFYQDTLGLEVSEQMDGLSIKCDGQKVFIYPKEDHKPATFTVFNLVVDDIDAAVDELTADGLVFERYDDMPGEQDERGIMRGKDAGMGSDIAWFKDPAGNILAVMNSDD